MERDKLSNEQNNKIFEKEILPDYINSQINASEKPKAIILAGQPGAGKSGLASETIDSPDFNNNHVRVDIDALRGYHPRYKNYRTDNPKEAANLVQTDASKWGSKLRGHVIENKYNVVIDGTLGDPKSATDLVGDLKKRGYDVEVHAYALDQDRSNQGIHSRYEGGLKEGKARWVPNDVANEAYEGIPKSLDSIEKNHPDVKISIYGVEGITLEDDYRINRVIEQPDGVSAGQHCETIRCREYSAPENRLYEKSSDRIIGDMNSRGASDKEMSFAKKTLQGERYKNALKSNSKDKEMSPEEALKKKHPNARLWNARSGQYSGRITHITENEVIQQTGKKDFYSHKMDAKKYDLKVGDEVKITNRNGKVSVINMSVNKSKKKSATKGKTLGGIAGKRGKSLGRSMDR